jgi:hypothetical protein
MIAGLIGAQLTLDAETAASSQAMALALAGLTLNAVDGWRSYRLPQGTRNFNRIMFGFAGGVGFCVVLRVLEMTVGRVL